MVNSSGQHPCQHNMSMHAEHAEGIQANVHTQLACIRIKWHQCAPRHMISVSPCCMRVGVSSALSHIGFDRRLPQRASSVQPRKKM